MTEAKPNKAKILDQYAKYVIGCYTKQPVVFTRGKDVWLWDDSGKKYLDYFSGWAVSSLGHCHPRISGAIRAQADRMIHVPNNFFHAGQGALAEAIIRRAFPGKVFFCNSGAEAVEAAIKLARAYGFASKRTEIVTMFRSFHGRTMGAMSATGQLKYQKGVLPLLGGFKMVSLNDMASLKKAINPKTIAVMLEPVQGEGGVNIAETAYLKELRRICDQRDILLIADEVQTGFGRTGEWFGFKHSGVVPDIMTLAKSLGGGFPVGALVAGRKVQDVFKPGMHASTFGGSPLACAAALAAVDAIEKENILPRVRKMGAYLLKGLSRLKDKYPTLVSDVRGRGLLVAMELRVPAKPIYDFCFKEAILINVTQDLVVRLAPPLTVKTAETDRLLAALDRALAQMAQGAIKHRE
jgi:acetylornithine aminotransferase/acetylornithine/N-succinyldiaminopimelate aminotransferase